MKFCRFHLMRSSGVKDRESKREKNTVYRWRGKGGEEKRGKDFIETSTAFD